MDLAHNNMNDAWFAKYGVWPDSMQQHVFNWSLDETDFQPFIVLLCASCWQVHRHFCGLELGLGVVLVH